MNINYSNIILLYNLAIIILICIIFIIVIKRYLSNTYDKIENFNMKDSTINYNNNFKYIPSNARIMYENSGIYPWNRHIINSSIPYDVNVKKEAVNVYYYEFDNNTYNEKLKDVFKNNCKDLIIAIEGNKWSKWKNPKSEKDKDKIKLLLNYYNSIYIYIYEKLNNNSIMDLPGKDVKQKIQIVHDLMLRYRNNVDYPEYYMFDIDLILYRAGKFQGKHVKAIAITNGSIINVILIKIIGVISEDNIVLHPFKGYDINNNNNFVQYVPMKYGAIENERTMSSKYTFYISDTYLDKELENIIFKKILEENIPEDIDISNINYEPTKEELAKSKKKRCLL
jgi:hypothetical protein